MELHLGTDPGGGVRRRVGAALFLTLAAVAGASCGTRVEQPTEGASASPSAAAPAVETASPAASGSVGASTPGAAGAVPLGGSASSGGGAVVGKEVASGSRGTQASSSGGATPGGSVSTGPGTAAAGGPAPSKPALPAPGSGGGNRGPEPTGVRSPVIVASVGTYSGPAGVALASMLQGVQLWVKHINERGGLNGHSVRLLSYDDGGDPARHRAQVQEAVEGKHAIAFVMNAEGIGTGEGSVEYLNAKRIPVMGMDGGSGWAYSSPMYFPQMSQGQYNTRMTVPSIARQLIPQGKTKLGTSICVEAPICDETDSVVAESVKGSGLGHVYRGRASLAQPDFTAECLSARNAGAQILFLTLDQNSVARVSASCARQGYRPTFSVVQQVASRTMAETPTSREGRRPAPQRPTFNRERRPPMSSKLPPGPPASPRETGSEGGRCWPGPPASCWRGREPR